MNNHFKKFSIFAIVILVVSFTTSILSATFTSAIDPDLRQGSESNLKSESKSGSYVNSECQDFLGLTSWNCGVVIKDQETLKTGIWQIAVNVLTDITVIATYLVIGYVIYGGYQYTFSGGDPTKVAKGRKTLTQAFIGLAIVLAAAAIMSTIRAVLLTQNGTFASCTSKECANPTTLVTNVIDWFTGTIGIVSAVFVVYGGISYMTSTGDPGKLEKAKKMILYALIGLAVVALSVVITTFVKRNIDTAVENAYSNETIISKEANEI